MKKMVRLVTTLGGVASLALIVPAFANEPEPDLAKDAAQGSGLPMTVPHAIKPGADDGESCNACHRTGIKKAPPTSHPERLNCTQCHVQGAVKKPAKNKAKK